MRLCTRYNKTQRPIVTAHQTQMALIDDLKLIVSSLLIINYYIVVLIKGTWQVHF